MNLLKVICNAAAGTSVFEFGKREKVYEWDKTSLLVDCISQVFYNTPPEWSGSIEVYFELKGKNYCAGRKMHNGKSSIYLAGEVKGKLLLLAFDNETMHAYLNDEAGCDFNLILERCLISCARFKSFCDDPNANCFGMVKKAREESVLEFDLALVEALRAKSANEIKKADVDAIKDKLDVAKEEKEGLSRSMSDMKAEQAELAALLKNEDERKKLLRIKSELDEREKIVNENRRKINDSEKALPILELSKKEKEINDEIAELSKEKDNGAKITAALITAQAYAEKQENNKKIEEKYKSLEADKEKLEKEKKDLDNVIATLKKEKEEFFKSAGAEKVKKEADDKAKAETIEAIKKVEQEKKSNTEKTEKVKQELDRLTEERTLAEKEYVEIQALGLSQKTFNEEKQREKLSREQAEKVEKANANMQADKDKVASELKEIEEKIDDLKTQIELLDSKKTQNEAIKAEIEFDLDPKNNLNTIKKYFGRGCTPDGVKKKKNALKDYLVEIEKELGECDCQLNKLQNELQLLQNEYDEKKKVAERNAEPLPPVEIFTAPVREYEGVCGLYITALLKGEGDAFYNQKKEKKESLFKKEEECNKALTECLAKEKKLMQECEALNKKLEQAPQTEVKEAVFDKQSRLDEAMRKREANAKQLALTNKKLENSARVNNEEPSEEIKEYLKEPKTIPVLIGNMALKRKKLEEKLAELEKEKKENTEKLNQAEKEFNKSKVAAKDAILTEQDKQKLQVEIDAFTAERTANEKALKECCPVSADAEERAKELMVLLAEAENAVIDKNEEIARLQEKYSATKNEYQEYRDALRQLDMAIIAVDSVKDRKFRSSNDAVEYLKVYSEQANKLMKKLTSNVYGLNIEQGLNVLDSKGNNVDWSQLPKDDKLMAYISCAHALPNMEGITADWLLVDGAIPDDCDKANKIFEAFKVKHKFKFSFLEKDKGDGEEGERAVASKQTDESEA